MFADNNNGVPGSIQVVTLTGTRTAPAVSLVGLAAGNILAFGGVPIHTASAPMSFMLSNTGTAPLTINSIQINVALSANPSEFTPSNNCPTSLAANANCTITVTFAPLATGPRSAMLAIADNAVNGNPQQVSLTGTGTSFSISVSPLAGFTETVTLGCSVSPALPKTTCTTPISATVNGSTMFVSASAKNSSKGTFMLDFSATFTATSPASGMLSESSPLVTLKVK